MPPKKNINLERVIDTAVTLADSHGIEAVTLARIAEELGIRVPSLYNYIAGLHGLHHEMRLWGLLQLGDSMRRAAVGRSGADGVISVAVAYRAFALAHPGVYPMTLNAPAPDETDIIGAGDEIIAVMTAVLNPFALNAHNLIHAIRAVRSIVHGFVSLEIAGGFGLPQDRDESFQLLLNLCVKGLEAQRLTQES